MPICNKCKMQFKTYAKINGKLKNLQNRKYCLECSPFGMHNTSKIHLNSTDRIKEGNGYHTSHQCICNACGRHYIYISNNRSGHTLTKCNSCCVNLRRKEIKRKAVDYKGGKCYICGYNKCIEALEFHHIDMEKKDFSLSGRHCYKWERIKNELDKCLCLCANCHREEHVRIDSL